MPPCLLAMMQRRTPPSLALGILAAGVCVLVETLLAELLAQITPVRSLGVLYLLGIVVVASVWGLVLGMATALVSTIALDYFLIPPIGSVTFGKAEDWTVFVVFLGVAALAGSISKLARSLAVEGDARAEADLAADLARILLRAPDPEIARAEAARHLARALELPSAAIRLGAIADDEDQTALPLRCPHGTVASLIVPADLPRPTLRRLRERVVPSLEVLLEAARERERITDEQEALRRLATLVAFGAPPGEVFAAVAREVGQLIEVPHATVLRYEPDATVTVVGVWRNDMTPLGSRWPLDKGSPAELVARTKAPTRVDAIEALKGAGELLTVLRAMGINSAVGCPVMVGGQLWGAVTAGSTSDPLPDDTEERMVEFTDLLVAAIANAESYAKLEASRSRVLAAGDATRRLIERDLHDGTQHRLVSLLLELRAAQTMVPPELHELNGRLSHTTVVLDEVLEDLRGIARGLLPALLSREGLDPAIKALARASAVPVELNLSGHEDLPERFEVTVYHVVAEALTNAHKHADASVVQLDLIVKDTVWLSVRDDGKGGAAPWHGSGLVSITDRVEALGGSLEITSPVGGGTALVAEIPIAHD